MLMGAPSPVFYEKKTSNNKQMATIPEDRYPPDFEDLWAKEGPGFSGAPNENIVQNH